MKKEYEFDGAELVNRLCKATNKSQKQLAIELHVSESTVTNWKKKSIMPKTEQLTQIYNVYGLSADYLLGFEKAGSTTETPKDKTPRTFKELLREVMLYDVFTEEKPISDYPAQMYLGKRTFDKENGLPLGIEVYIRFLLKGGETLDVFNIESAIEQYNKIRPALSMDAIKDKATLLIDDALSHESLPFD